MDYSNTTTSASTPTSISILENHPGKFSETETTDTFVIK